MTARELQYDFKQKLNRIDSQKFRNLLVPEIDWKLNEAQELFAKMIAQPRLRSQYGFEINQRTIDDIRTIVIDQKKVDGAVPSVYDVSSFSYVITLPEDYWYYSSGRVYATKGNCTDIRLKAKEIQHDDEAELSPFDRSSFEWRVSNIWFNSQGIVIFTDGTYTPTRFPIQYLKQPRIIHNAEDFEGGTYDTLEGVSLVGMSNCELPIGVHREVVDLAVLITSIDLNMPNVQLKQNKVRLDQ